MLVLSYSICLLSNTRMVYADIIPEPYDDFFQDYANEMEYHLQTRVANSKKGYANLYKNPESDIVITYVKNGTEITVKYLYTDKNDCVWALVEPNLEVIGNDYDTAWIRLDDFTLVYDARQFRKDNLEKLVEEKVKFDVSQYDKNIIMWSFPLSGKRVYDIDITSDYVDYVSATLESDLHATYEDQFHQKWVEYYDWSKRIQGWICITDPCNKDMRVDDKVNYEAYPPAAPKLKDQMSTTVKLSIILVLLVVGTTVVIIYVKHRGPRK